MNKTRLMSVYHDKQHIINIEVDYYSSFFPAQILDWYSEEYALSREKLSWSFAESIKCPLTPEQINDKINTSTLFKKDLL